MVDIPYIQYDLDDMILRDFLALHRSQLANERTLLAYGRTGLAISGGGITFAKLFKDAFIQTLGWILIPIGFSIIFLGLYRFFSVRKSFADLSADKSSHQKETEELLIDADENGNGKSEKQKVETKITE